MTEPRTLAKHAGRTGPALALAVLASLSTTAFAAPGGGKGKPGGDGGEEPPPEPDPAPVSYVLTWVGTGPADGAPDPSRLYDVDSNGVAVGQVLPDGVSANRYGVVSFPDRSEMIDLEALCSTHPDYPAGWNLTFGYRISDNLLISGDLYDPSGVMHTFATQLVDNGPSAPPTVAWFRYFRASDYGATSDYGYLRDSSEAGELLVQVQMDGPNSFLWNPVTDQAIGPFGYYFEVNNARQMINRDELYDADQLPDLTPQALPNTIDNRTEGDAWDISEAGTVAGVIRNLKGQGTEALGRIVNGSWQAVGPSVSGMLHSAVCSINSTEQILGVTGGRLGFYSDDPAVGYRWVDDLVAGTTADLALWDSAEGIGFLSTPAFSLSDVDATGYGTICGARTVNGIERGFILTPVLVP